MNHQNFAWSEILLYWSDIHLEHFFRENDKRFIPDYIFSLLSKSNNLSEIFLVKY